jgi:hypothetical protein
LTDHDVIDQAAKAAFKTLQDKARAEHGSNTGALMVVYAVESFLRRLAMSEYAEQMVLKGGMLMAANDIRQMTVDADLSSHSIAKDEDDVREVIAQISVLTPDPPDGIVIEIATIRTKPMREDDESRGVRCKLVWPDPVCRSTTRRSGSRVWLCTRPCRASLESRCDLSIGFAAKESESLACPELRKPRGI